MSKPSIETQFPHILDDGIDQLPFRFTEAYPAGINHGN